VCGGVCVWACVRAWEGDVSSSKGAKKLKRRKKRGAGQ
jgi:hypothetical protein